MKSHNNYKGKAKEETLYFLDCGTDKQQVQNCINSLPVDAWLLTREKSADDTSIFTLYYRDKTHALHQIKLHSRVLQNIFGRFIDQVDNEKIKIKKDELTKINETLTFELERLHRELNQLAQMIAIRKRQLYLESEESSMEEEITFSFNEDDKNPDWQTATPGEVNIKKVVEVIRKDSVHAATARSMLRKQEAQGYMGRQRSFLQPDVKASNIVYMEKIKDKKKQTNEETRQMQELLDALLSNKADVEFFIDKSNKRIMATVKKKNNLLPAPVRTKSQEYNVTDLLENIDWSQISFQEKSLRKYTDYVFNNHVTAQGQTQRVSNMPTMLFKPSLPNEIDPDAGKPAVKIKPDTNKTEPVTAPPFKCDLLFTEPDAEAIFGSNPDLNAVYVLHEGQLYFANAQTRLFEIVGKPAQTLPANLMKNAFHANYSEQLLYYMNTTFQHEGGIAARKSYWEWWYREQIKNYKKSHSDSKLDEWNFAEMLGMNLYTGKFHAYANKLLRGDFDGLFENKKIMVQNKKANNEIRYLVNLDNSAITSSVMKELMLGTAMSLHGMHKHPEIKRDVVRRDLFTEGLYQSKINEFDIILYKIENNERNLNELFKSLRELSEKYGTLPVMIEIDGDYYIAGLKNGNWSVAKVEKNLVKDIQFPDQNFKEDILIGKKISDALLNEIKKVHEKQFDEKSYVSTAFAETSYIDEEQLTKQIKEKRHFLVFYRDAEGVDVLPISENQGESEFTLRPGKYVYEKIKEVDGVTVLVAHQIKTESHELKRAETRASLVNKLRDASTKKNQQELIEHLSTRSPQEQYKHNIKAWRAFLNENPGVYPDDPHYAARQKAMRKIFALLDYLGMGVEDISHGGRLRLKSDDMVAIFNEIRRENPAIFLRPAASHKTAYEKENNYYKEKRLHGFGTLGFIPDIPDYWNAFWSDEHWGMDLGVSAEAIPTAADGSHGHLYINLFTADSTGKGAILIGVEGAGPGKDTQFGEHHGVGADANELSATGATKYEKSKPGTYIRPNEPYVDIEKVKEALEYIERNYQKIDEKWADSLKEENDRLQEIQKRNKCIARVEKQLKPSSNYRHHNTDLCYLDFHHQRANLLLDKIEVASNKCPLSLELIEAETKRNLKNLDKYIDAITTTPGATKHHAESLKQAYEMRAAIVATENRIARMKNMVNVDSNQYGFVATSSKILTTNDRDKALRNRNQWLNDLNPAASGIGSFGVATPQIGKFGKTSKQYVVTQTTHGKIKTVTMRKKTENGTHTTVSFPNSMNEHFKSDRQKKSNGVIPHFLKKGGTRIPNQDCMNLIADLVTSELLAASQKSGKKEIVKIRIDGDLTKELTEAFQIYERLCKINYSVEENPLPPFRCEFSDELDGFKLDEATLEKKLKIYEKIARETPHGDPLLFEKPLLEIKPAIKPPKPTPPGAPPK